MPEWLAHLSDLQRLILAMACLVGLVLTAVSIIDPEL